MFHFTLALSPQISCPSQGDRPQEHLFLPTTNTLLSAVPQQVQLLPIGKHYMQRQNLQPEKKQQLKA